MDRKAHLLFCEKCVNRKFIREKGIVCKLTDEYADFDGYCPDFKENELALHKLAKENDKVGGGIRFANFIIDRIVHAGIVFGLSFFLAMMNVSFIYNLNRVEEILFDWSIYILYYIVLEYNFQISVGKLITKTVVVDSDGNKPTLKAIVGRSFTRIVPFEAFSFLGGEASGWHDKWSNTKVIKRNSMKNSFNEDSDILDQEFMTD